MIADNGRKFPCHKLVLSIRSEVLRAMLDNEDNMETKENELVLTGMSPKVVEAFHWYLYHGYFLSSATDGGSISSLLVLADM